MITQTRYIPNFIEMPKIRNEIAKAETKNNN